MYYNNPKYRKSCCKPGTKSKLTGKAKIRILNVMICVRCIQNWVFCLDLLKRWSKHDCEQRSLWYQYQRQLVQLNRKLKAKQLQYSWRCKKEFSSSSVISSMTLQLWREFWRCTKGMLFPSAWFQRPCYLGLPFILMHTKTFFWSAIQHLWRYLKMARFIDSLQYTSHSLITYAVITVILISHTYHFVM